LFGAAIVVTATKCHRYFSYLSEFCIRALSRYKIQITIWSSKQVHCIWSKLLQEIFSRNYTIPRIYIQLEKIG